MYMAKGIHAAVVCHKGCVRGNNEDNFFFNGDFMPLQEMNEGAMIEHTFTDKHQLYGVFDGMGGGEWGERASAIAAQTIQTTYLAMKKGDIAKHLNDFAYRANARVVEDGRAHQVDTQGTTMAVLAISGAAAQVANVGDSRVYLLRDSQLKQLSMDHSMVGELVREGHMTAEQARKSSNNNVITHYLGMPDDELPTQLVYQVTEEVKDGDRFMLCSDGLCDLMSNAALERKLRSFDQPLDCARQLVMDALEMGGKDNTTVIVLDCGDFKATPVPEPVVRPPMQAPVVPEVPAALAAKPAEDDDTHLL